MPKCDERSESRYGNTFFGLPHMTPFPSNSIRRALAAATIGIIGATTVGASVSADQPALPTNALASQITTEAELAVNALDEFVESDDLGDYLEYARHRIATARLAARELGYDEFAMIDAWSDASLDHQRAVLSAMTQVGVPYRTNASEAGKGFDCSGLTAFAWQQSGIDLARYSGDQIRSAESVDHAEAMAGDLVHYPGHVMMYLGVDNAVIHSVRTGRTVEIDTISDRRVATVSFGDPIETVDERSAVPGSDVTNHPLG